MTQVDQLEIVHPDGRVQFVDLDSTIGVLNIGRHPENDVVLDGPNVLPFHALIDFRNNVYQFITFDQDGSSTSTTPLDSWQTVHLGAYELLIVDSRNNGHPVQTPSAERDPTSRGPQAESAGHAATNQPSPNSPTHVRQEARVGPATSWHMTPGRDFVHPLTIEHRGSSEALFILEGSGIPDAWLHPPRQEIRLAPDEQANPQIVVRPPGDNAVGQYDFVWRLWSPDHPGWEESESVRIIVGHSQPTIRNSTQGPQSIEFLAISPDPVKSPFLGWTGKATLRLANWSQHHVDYLLWGKDVRGECSISFPSATVSVEPRPGKSREPAILAVQEHRVTVPPGQEIEIPIQIHPSERPLLGITTQTNRFVIRGRKVNNGDESSITGVFESRPFVDGGILAVFFLLLLLGLLLFFRQDIAEWTNQLLYGMTVSRSANELPTPAAPLGGAAVPMANIPTTNAAGEAAGGSAATPTTYEEMFREVGSRYNVDWRLLASLSYRESRLDPQALGQSGEYGLMQIMPATWDEWAPLVGVDNPWDPYSNILVGAAYLTYIHAYLSDQGYSDLRWAIAAYNWGPERVLTVLDRNGSWNEIPIMQRHYVADILIDVDRSGQRLREAMSNFETIGD